MKDTLNVLTTNPEIGIISSLGSGVVYWLNLLNPVMSFLTLCVGLLIGLLTLAIKLREWNNG